MRKLTTVNNLIEHYPRLGVVDKFPTPVNYKKRISKLLTDRQYEENQLTQYSQQGEFVYDNPHELPGVPSQLVYDIFSTQVGLVRLAINFRFLAIELALSGDKNEWCQHFQRAHAYYYWGLRVKYLDARKIYDDFKSGKREQLNTFLLLQQDVAIVASCIIFGWSDWGVQLASEINWGIQNNCIDDATDDYGRRRTQLFVLRLINNWQGWAEENCPQCAYDEPIFNALIEHWRTEDIPLIEHLLLAACDRRTHQSKEDKDDGLTFYDIPTDQWYTPYEILLVLRLRQIHGLENPQLDHVVMNTPLGQLPKICEPYTDTLLEGVIARMAQTYPELLDGTNIQPLPDAMVSVDNQTKKTSWFKKLLGSD